ncbi:hypothetical protein SBBP1_330002 [Burkholderiales bacterium]|nr:hypothetical protein SBBP1_330002 [Burkholderiales bacterium]
MHNGDVIELAGVQMEFTHPGPQQN